MAMYIQMGVHILFGFLIAAFFFQSLKWLYKIAGLKFAMYGDDLSFCFSYLHPQSAAITDISNHILFMWCWGLISWLPECRALNPLGHSISISSIHPIWSRNFKILNICRKGSYTHIKLLSALYFAVKKYWKQCKYPWILEYLYNDTLCHIEK